MTRYQLEVEYDYDFILIGISCHAKDYRMCWGLNSALSLDLQNQTEDIEIVHKNPNRSSFHSVYVYYNEENHTEYNLVLNKSNGNWLIPEQRQADYFLLVRNNFEDDINELITSVRKIDFVLTAFEVDVSSLKSRQNLMF